MCSTAGKSVGPKPRWRQKSGYVANFPTASQWVQRWRNVKRYFQRRLVTDQAHTLANAIRTVLGFDAEDKVKYGERQIAILRR